MGQTLYKYAFAIVYTMILKGCKNDIFLMKKEFFLIIFAQNIDCGYTLEPPQCWHDGL